MYKDEKNPEFIFNMTHTDLLVKAIKREIDLGDLVKRQLAGRGLDSNGIWIGFEKAKKHHRLK
ncbi:MAG: hypothetical protein K9J12_12500 [Melioribacteraceae bacterium]|nr:hypothetical protein [Melioribacteraceae bacterium]MCF8265805.1 hypothetical protein [Melioribacteraceae bacterium]MCF8414526.1 hypothetical protein [Melioribacteraceae bacterium]MCF8430534.1 hypothetical protein [Melioribacteraceae bacterium]